MVVSTSALLFGRCLSTARKAAKPAMLFTVPKPIRWKRAGTKAMNEAVYDRFESDSTVEAGPIYAEPLEGLEDPERIDQERNRITKPSLGDYRTDSEDSKALDMYLREKFLDDFNTINSLEFSKKKKVPLESFWGGESFFVSMSLLRSIREKKVSTTPVEDINEPTENYLLSGGKIWQNMTTVSEEFKPERTWIPAKDDTSDMPQHRVTEEIARMRKHFEWNPETKLGFKMHEVVKRGQIVEAVDEDYHHSLSGEVDMDEKQTKQVPSGFRFYRVKTGIRSVTINRVRGFLFYVIIVGGNGRGAAGYGVGVSENIEDAEMAAKKDLLKNVMYIPLTPDRCLWESVSAKDRATTVIIKSTQGRRINKGSRELYFLLELAGIRGATIHRIGSPNRLSLVRAAFKALAKAVDPTEKAIQTLRPTLPSIVYSSMAFVEPKDLKTVYDEYAIKDSGLGENQDMLAIMRNLDRLNILSEKSTPKDNQLSDR